MRKTIEREFNSNIKNVVKVILTAALIGIFVLLILSALHATYLCLFGMSENAAKLISFIAWGLCAFVSGFIALRAIGKRGLVYGAITGVAFFLCVLVIGVISTGHIKAISNIWGNLVIALVSSAAGGIIGVNKK